MDNTIDNLREHYLSLINEQLPNRAKQVSMPVRFNHCFARIVLDNLFEGCWYDSLSRKLPAYKQLNEEQLVRAIAIAQQMLTDSKSVTWLNENSLRWRGKLGE
ncbi:hypothetical protein S7335_4710 [Synechococcus sp. PCC 7335]|uniref:hypothetical protein n=1 Tax=Synechococcus sp. (strain ATCC 29403 / PCC 7335) TaxID=91464 RepID=UPI00017EBF96|nr:hypothetical protein [Synechococcus sp. PCC 7335]EDX87003.1 hypothetical protein S7335_4710 [Synechococcus sp. PCC 7335]